MREYIKIDTNKLARHFENYGLNDIAEYWKRFDKITIELVEKNEFWLSIKYPVLLYNLACDLLEIASKPFDISMINRIVSIFTNSIVEHSSNIAFTIIVNKFETFLFRRAIIETYKDIEFAQNIIRECDHE